MVANRTYSEIMADCENKFGTARIATIIHLASELELAEIQLSFRFWGSALPRCSMTSL